MDYWDLWWAFLHGFLEPEDDEDTEDEEDEEDEEIDYGVFIAEGS